jgi:aspartyl protease family protein
MVRILVIGLVAVLSAFGMAQSLSMFGQRSQTLQQTAVAVTASPPAPVAPPTPQLGPGEASIVRSPDGQFWADAYVDGHPMRFLVDTGATAVALTSDDARTLGINPDSLTYSYTVSTANGQARAAPVRLGLVSVGGAEVANVDAFVIEKGLPTSLLGMTYLGRLAKVEATPQAMVLRS